MRAHAPGSITGLFAPPAGDMTEGAAGASVAIEDGVTAAVAPADATTIRVDGEPTAFEPVERILSRLDVTATVDLAPEVPIGRGFGASGAATLATALAANARLDLGLDRDTLVEHAHRAEVAAGTGLGDVFIQDAGGLLWSDGGDRARREVDAAVEYVSYGGIATSDVLADGDAVERFRRVGLELLEALPATPTLADIARASWAFAEQTGVATDRVGRAVERVRDAGGAAGMAMLGETAFAVGVDGVLDRRTTVSNRGARLVDQNS